jgi:hypothetical protein
MNNPNSTQRIIEEISALLPDRQTAVINPSNEMKTQSVQV